MKGLKKQFTILWLDKSDLKKPPKDVVAKARKFEPQLLMSHGLFKKHKPVLFGGAALSFHHYKVLSLQWNREIDDMDFYVVDKQVYDDFANNRKIQFQNKHDKRLHFYEKLGEDYYIRVTICLIPQWKQKYYEAILGIRVLCLAELKKLKTKQHIDPSIEQRYKRGNSPTKYFIRKAKKGKDIDDIFLINCLLNNGDKTK